LPHLGLVPCANVLRPCLPQPTRRITPHLQANPNAPRAFACRPCHQWLCSQQCTFHRYPRLVACSKPADGCGSGYHSGSTHASRHQHSCCNRSLQPVGHQRERQHREQWRSSCVWHRQPCCWDASWCALWRACSLRASTAGPPVAACLHALFWKGAPAPSA
jgi:hypothetical protein